MKVKESAQEEDQDWDGNNWKEKWHTHEAKGYGKELRRALEEDGEAWLVDKLLQSGNV